MKAELPEILEARKIARIWCSKKRSPFRAVFNLRQ